jgi:hypothetical protein
MRKTVAATVTSNILDFMHVILHYCFDSRPMNEQ